jgi:hypothetical protein
METQEMTASLDALPTHLAPPTAEEQHEQFYKVYVAHAGDQVVGDLV